MIYQIVDWQIHFENDRSKERDRCSFVCVPNKQHGMGFSYVMREKDGAAIYGIWQLILGACSQQKRPRNGWLTSNGESGGSPWGVADLSVKFHRPEAEISRAIEFLSSEKVGWIRVIQTVDNEDLPPTPDAPPTDSPPTPLEGNGKEGKEEKVVAAPSAAATGEHQAFIQGWSENFLAVHKVKYQFDGGKDGKAVRELLKMGIQRIDILEIAKKAWAWKGNVFLSGKSLTIHGFRQHFNEINSGVTNGTNPRRNHSAAYSGTVDDNPRNAGTCKPVTDYAAAALKRQQQQRDRQAESEAALAGEMASNETPPPPATGNG